MSGSPSSSAGSAAAGRRRTGGRAHAAEDQALNQVAKEAEKRLAAKRAERAQARQIRLKELEKQQKEVDEKSDRQYEQLSTDQKQVNMRASPYTARSQTDESAEEAARDLKLQLRELEDKYKKAMMTNAQLDNEKQALIYQVDLCKDRLDDADETSLEMGRDFKDKCRQLDNHKRSLASLEREYESLKEQLAQRDKLIQDYGLVIVGSETGELTLARNPDASCNGTVLQIGAALVSSEAAHILEQAGDGTLDERLKRFATDKMKLEIEMKRVCEELEEERAKSQLSEKFSSPKSPQMNGPEMQLYEVQREASKQIHEYKLKLQKADQDIATLEGSVSRLDSQAKRYRQAAENAEKVEDELKQEKRRLQKEVREAQNQIEELQNKNVHLQKRMEKLKQDRIAALVGQ